MHNLVRSIKHSRIASRSILCEHRSTPGLLSSSSSSASFTPHERSTPPRPAGAKRNPFPHRASALTFLHLFLVRARPATTTCAHICIRHRIRKDVSCTWIYGRTSGKSKCSSRGKDERTDARRGKCARDLCNDLCKLARFNGRTMQLSSANRIYD